MLTTQHGMLLITGPTGSGKTTTLYACLREIQAQRQAMIVTLEDPVECYLPGVRQSPIHAISGYTFSKGLRALLRQDPDVIMIGEIRDADTASIAFHAAYTGHLVLASLHTHDVATSLMRLLSFNIDPFLIGYALKGIMSQQLVNTNASTTPRTIITESLHIQHPMMLSMDTHAMDAFIANNIFIPFNTDIQEKINQGITTHDHTQHI